VAAFLQQADTLLGAIHAKVPALEPGLPVVPCVGAAVVPEPSAWGAGRELGGRARCKMGSRNSKLSFAASLSAGAEGRALFSSHC